MVVAAKDEFGNRIDRLTQRLQRRGARRPAAAPRRRPRADAAAAAWRAGTARLAMRGRHAAELTHQLRRAVLARDRAPRRASYRGAAAAARAARPRAGASPSIRGRLTTADGRLRARRARATGIAPTRASARWPAGSRTSARSPSSAAAMRCAGTRTGRRSSAARDVARRSRARDAAHGEIECAGRATGEQEDGELE